MTYCNTLFEPLIRRIEIEKKTLDEIADEVCGDTVKNPRQKIIRIIKVLLGEEYLIEHAQTLGYNTVKAVRQKSTIDEVVNRKIVSEKEVEDSDNLGQTGQEEVFEVLNTAPNVCCQKQAAKVRKIDSENRNEGESGETKEPEQGVEENDDAPVVDVALELVGEIKRLIGLYSLEEVKKALEVAESDI